MSRFDATLRELRALLDEDQADSGIALFRAAQIVRTVVAAAERNGHPLPQVRQVLRTLELQALALQTGLAAEEIDADLPPLGPWPPPGRTGAP
jgi:hypothetical protein